MRIVFNILIWTGVILFTLAIQGCKKEKCGCDGEILFEVEDVPGRLYYDKETKYTWFESTSVYSFFTFCYPEKIWDDILEFEHGEEVLLSGEVSDDCEKQVNYYASNKYVIHVTEIKLD
ncbi:unnamed protein product, partial [marine sediment metagenome]